VSVARRIDYYDDPSAPPATSLVPSVNVIVANDAGEILMIGTSAGRSGLELNYSVTQHTGQVELYIDRGAQAANTAIFEQFVACKDEIEKAFGDALDWQPLEGRKACRIRWRTDQAGYRDEEQWPALEETLIDAMIRLERALRPHINSLQV
jgi:hypothetical protein